MNIYLVRHGESELNKVSVHQTEDTPLSPEGIKQANKLAERIKKLKIDFIYSSPYKRAKQTAEIISKKLKKPIEYCGGHTTRDEKPFRNPSIALRS